MEGHEITIDTDDVLEAFETVQGRWKFSQVFLLDISVVKSDRGCDSFHNGSHLLRRLPNGIEASVSHNDGVLDFLWKRLQRAC